MVESCLHSPWGRGGGAQAAVPSVLHAFTPLHLPPEVSYRYVTAKVQADLPALRVEGGEDAIGAARMAGVLRTLGLARGPRGDTTEDDEE